MARDSRKPTSTFFTFYKLMGWMTGQPKLVGFS